MTRGRLAPSPTGAQHVGNARTYLIAWLAARSRGDEIALRIEDIDSPRIKQGATAAIYDDLNWLRLNWDGEVVVQSTRLDLYQSTLQSLTECELVYPCTCSRSDIAEAASAPHEAHESPPYPGTCRHRSVADAASLDRPFTWRFRVDRSPEFVDDYRGVTRIDLNRAGGDFVVWKSDGTPAYQLAVVVDDADMHIGEVIRGDDLLTSTPRQLLLYEALGLAPPRFAHVPLVTGPDGRRLAKRHGDTRLSSLRAAGVKPTALIGLLAWSCGWHATACPIDAHDLISAFDLRTIPPTPFVLTSELLARIGYTT